MRPQIFRNHKILNYKGRIKRSQEAKMEAKPIFQQSKDKLLFFMLLFRHPSGVPPRMAMLISQSTSLFAKMVSSNLLS